MKDKTKSLLTSENIIFVILLLLGLLLPTFTNAYRLSQYSYYYSMTILALSITLVWGYAGIFSFGQAAFMGLGAYIYGILSIAAGRDGFNIFALLIAVVIMMALGAALAYFMFYGGVNDVFVGLITMCFGIALQTFMGQTAGEEWQVFGVRLGGYNGLTGIPKISLFGFKLGDVAFYFFTFIVLISVYAAIRYTKKTNAGYSLTAIRENRSRSELFGFNVPKIQVIVFAISTGLAALAGVLYSVWGSYIAPDNLSMTQSTIPVVIVASGGRKNPTATVLFAILYYILSGKLAASGSSLNYIILGAILIVVLLFIPEGLFSTLFSKIDKYILRRA
ncbi:MAG: urea ABC transporter permease [Butyrivibrio sp.]|nr:urea ABC transporter permease [Butyrivibrio sp.]